MFSTLYRVFWIYKNEDVLIQWSITSEAIFNKKKSIENIAKIIKWNNSEIYTIWDLWDIKKIFHNTKYCSKNIYFFYKKNNKITEIKDIWNIIKNLMDIKNHLYLYRCASKYIYF